MTFWLGNPGALAALPPPRKGINPTSVRPASVVQTIGGGQIVNRRPPPGRRTYQLDWSGLTAEQYSVLEEFYTGARGQGPFALLDPGRRNKLSANQASATTVAATAAGFTVDASEAVTSTADAYSRGPRSLRWTLPQTVTSGVLDLDPPAGLIGIPAPSGQAWTFTGVLSATNVAVTVTPVLSWRRIDGSQVAATTGTPVAATPGSWSAFTVSDVPPAGAVAVRVRLTVAPGVLPLVTSSIGAGSLRGPTVPYRPPSGAVVQSRSSWSTTIVDHPPQPARGGALIMQAPVLTAGVLVDQLQLDMNATARTWVIGTGVPLVSFTALGELYKTIPFHSCSATLVEVG